jgi:hypothetical protein
MAQFKHIPAARIVSQESFEGRNEAGEQVRYALITTEKVTYLQRYVDGVGVSTTQFSGARIADAPAAYDQAVMMELGQYIEDKAAAFLDEGAAALSTKILEAEPVAEPEPVAETPARRRSPNRPDAETQVWGEGDVAVVMVIGRGYRYDLRRGTDLIDRVTATRNWRQERRALIAQGQGLLATAA